jgi:uncharacterized DUF497 family protein
MRRIFKGFVWDAEKEMVNIEKHGVDFRRDAQVFADPHRKIFTDSRHSAKEARHFCIGKVEGRVLTVRFLYRDDKIRIFGAGFWRKGKIYYEENE